MGNQVTNINALGLVILFTLIGMIFLCGRRWLPLPLIIAGTWITLGQRLVILDLNLPALRLAVIAVMVRMLVRGEWSRIATVPLDRLFLLWHGLRIVTFTLLMLSPDALVNRAALALDAIGLYFCFRFAIRDLTDVARIGKMMAFVITPVAILMVVERDTGYNWFSLLGSVPELSYTRNGTVRAQGSFMHPILAGTVGALWVPVFFGLWKSGAHRVAAVVGMVAGVVMLVTSASSGPILTLLFGIGSLGLWGMRHRMQMIRIGIVVALFVIQLFMNAPIWYLMARINIVSGSTGWHRSHLIDMAVRHFWEWCLVGVKDVAAWGVFAGDVTNQYLLEGFRGGLVTMGVFILILVRLYSTIGRAVRSEWALPRGQRVFVWSLGAMLAAHTATFFSVAYFDSQSMLQWFLTVALLVAAGEAVEASCLELEEGVEGEVRIPLQGGLGPQGLSGVAP